MFISEFYFFVMILCLVCIFILMRHIRQLNGRIFDLTTENNKLSTDLQDENPLGKLFSPSTKTIAHSVTKKGCISDVSESFLKLLEYSKKELIGKEIYGLLMPKISLKEPLEMNIINRIFQNPNLYTEHETEFITKTGKKVWISWTNRIVKDKAGKPFELRSVGFDITPRKNLEEQLLFMASKDPQTGALNRLSLMENGTRELKRSIRYHHDLSVLALRLLSLDKNSPALTIEDQLKQVVSVCRRTIRDVDYLGRVGEAEFVLLLPETPKENVPFLEKRLEEKVHEYNEKNPLSPLQISFGISAYSEKTKSIDELISKALSNIKKGKTK